MSTPPTHVIEIASGAGEPAAMLLTIGQTLETLTLGTKGAWRITAPGVREIHAYLHFDGEALFVQPAQPSATVLVDDQPANAEGWSELDPPCSIALGDARLNVRVLEKNTVLIARPPMPIASRKARPFEKGAFAHRAGDESTRFAPVDVGMVAPVVPPAPTKLSEAIEGDVQGSTVVIPRDATWGSASSAPTRTPSSPAAELPRTITVEKASASKKRLLLAVAFVVPICALGLGGGLYWNAKRHATSQLPVSATSAPAVASPSSAAVPEGNGAAPSELLPAPTAFSPAMSRLRQSPSADAGRTSDGHRTLERQAADAVAINDYAVAANVYERLAKESPNNRIYAEAARIMRAKANAATP